jgi:uncharacterized protein with GYD domain
MAKFMIKGSDAAPGTKGLLTDGGSNRKASVEKMIKGLGGSMESFYYALGQDDVYVICDLPNAVSATAAALAVNSTGLVTISTVALLTVEEMDQACKKSVTYRAPGA